MLKSISDFSTRTPPDPDWGARGLRNPNLGLLCDFLGAGGSWLGGLTLTAQLLDEMRQLPLRINMKSPKIILR